jgi:hypothetical protein
MASLAEYFEKNRYKPKYFIGDRVHGHWNKIPFRGTVGNDSLVSEEEGPKISIFLDLPIKHDGKLHNIIHVKHKDILKSGASFFKEKK